jgi:WD40 repeat protein
MRQWLLAGFALAAIAAAPPRASLLRLQAKLDVGAKQRVCLAWRSDGKLLATGQLDFDSRTGRRGGEIKLWETASGKLLSTWKGHSDQPTALAFSPDGKMLVSVASSLERIHWNVATGKAERTLPGLGQYGGTRVVRFSSDGKRLGACGSEIDLVWDAAAGKELSRSTRKTYAWGGIFTHDLRFAAVPEYQDVDLWDVAGGKLDHSLLDHPGSAGVLSFSRDDRLLAVGVTKMDKKGYSSEVWLWDTRKRLPLRTLRLDDFYAREVELSPSGALVAVAGSLELTGPAQLRLFETARGRELTRMEIPGEGWIGNPLFSADGKLLATSCNEEVWVWRVNRPATGKRPRK